MDVFLYGPQLVAAIGLVVAGSVSGTVRKLYLSKGPFWTVGVVLIIYTALNCYSIVGGPYLLAYGFAGCFLLPPTPPRS